MKNIYLKILYTACIVITAVLLVVRVMVIFDSRIDVAGIEEVFVHYCLRLFNNYDIYLNPERPPYLNCQYNPLYFEVIAKLLKVFEVTEEQAIHTTYIIGRALGLACNIITAIAVGAIIRHHKRQSFWLPTASACFAFMLFTAHNYAVRPDSLKTLLVILSYLFFTQGVSSLRKWHIFLALIFAALAVVVKQDAFIYFTALVICLFAANVKWWRLYTAAFLLLFVGAYLAMATYYGNYFWVNSSIGLYFSYDLINALYFVFRPAALKLLLICGAVVFAINYLRNQKFGLTSLHAILLLLIIPPTFIISCKWGAAPVYFTDLVLLSFIILIILAPQPAADALRAPIVAVAFILASVGYDIYVGNIYYTMGRAGSWWQHYDADCTQVKKLIAAEKEPEAKILTFEKHLSNHFIGQAVFPAYETEFIGLLFTTNAYGNNANNWKNAFYSLPKQIFNYSEFHKQIHTGEIRYLIISRHADKPEFLNENFEEFKLYANTDLFDIYKFGSTNQH